MSPISEQEIEEVDKILAKRLLEPGTRTDALILFGYAKGAKSPKASKEERAASLQSLKNHKPTIDDFE